MRLIQGREKEEWEMKITVIAWEKMIHPTLFKDYQEGISFLQRDGWEKIGEINADNRDWTWKHKFFGKAYLYTTEV
jgi:hypothetical protein